MNLDAVLFNEAVLAVIDSPWMGKAAAMGVFALLILVLICMPAHLAGKSEGKPRWWRNVRVWAVLIALVQIIIYAWWG
jgi:hypothetical protein